MKKRHAKAIRRGIKGARLCKEDMRSSATEELHSKRFDLWQTAMQTQGKLTWEAFLRTYYGMEKP